MKVNYRVFIIMMLAAAVLAGCGKKEAGNAAESAPMEAHSVIESTVPADEGGSEGTSQGISAEETEPAGTEAGEGLTDSVRELDKKELSDLEKDFNELKYNGFFVAEFPSADSIYWDEVFYNGGGQGDPDIDYKELLEIYLKVTGEDEIYTDVSFLDRTKTEAFMEETTEIPLSEMVHPLSWTYLKEKDMYASEHGDTNYYPVKVLSGTEEDGVYKVRYCHMGYDFEDPGEGAPEYEVIFKRKNGGYVFISNLWSPEEGREAAVKAIYDEIIGKYAFGLREGWDPGEFEDNNLCYLAGYLNSSADPLNRAGYYITDLDGDGMDELIIGELKDKEAQYPKSLYEVYSARDGSWIRVFSGGERDRYYLSKDGTFYNEGSDSAFHSVLIHYEMAGSYKFLNPIDGVIYDAENGNNWDNWFYSKQDFYNRENEEPISEKEYNEYYEKAESSYEDIQFIPFSTVSGTVGNKPGEAVKKAEDTSEGYSDQELLDMALDYYERENSYRPGGADIDGRDGDTVTIHLYDDMGDHLATSGWYDIDCKTGKGTDGIFGNEVDLTR